MFRKTLWNRVWPRNSKVNPQGDTSVSSTSWGWSHSQRNSTSSGLVYGRSLRSHVLSNIVTCIRVKVLSHTAQRLMRKSSETVDSCFAPEFSSPCLHLSGMSLQGRVDTIFFDSAADFVIQATHSPLDRPLSVRKACQDLMSGHWSPRQRWAGCRMHRTPEASKGPFSKVEDLQLHLEAGCGSHFQLLSDKLAVDEENFDGRSIMEAYWATARSHFEEDLMDHCF